MHANTGGEPAHFILRLVKNTAICQEKGGERREYNQLKLHSRTSFLKTHKRPDTNLCITTEEREKKGERALFGTNRKRERRGAILIPGKKGKGKGERERGY